MSGLLHVTRRLVKQSNLLKSSVFVPGRQYSSTEKQSTIKQITFYFEDKQGNVFTIRGDVGDRLRRVMCRTIDIPNFGLCRGMPGCTTCHVVFDPEVYNKVTRPDKLEADLLSLTVAVTPRLSCQTFLEEGMDGMTVRLPEELKDIRTMY